MANTGKMEQPHRKGFFRWEWFSAVFMVIISFSSVLGASNLALRFSLAKTLNANVQTQRGANYGVDPRDTLAFAPVNPDILLEATADSAYLRITPTPEQELALEEVNVAGFFLLPTTVPNSPTQLPASPTPQPVAAGEKAPTTTPPVTQPTATATAVSPTTPAPIRTLTPTPTPQPSATAVTPTFTPVPPTGTAVPPATNTATPLPSVTPTINPSATSTIRPTTTVTPLPTYTATPSASATATPLPQPTTTATPSVTPTSTSTATPTPPPTSTSTATPTPTPTLEYHRIQPILNCITINGDDTVTAYYGYQNSNAQIVSILPGENNRFFPAPTNRGQPAFFRPGLHSFVFSVTVNKSLDTLFWYLDGNTTVTWPGSPTCP